MNSEEYTRIKEIFAKAAALPADERSMFLNQATDGNVELRREVEALLRHHDEPTSTVPSSAFEKSEVASSHAHGRSAQHLPIHPRKPERLPAKIGAYRVVREIGRGGMGMVYLGVREEGRFQKRVAIKVIKKGMDSEDVLRRFELERQLLSALNHPNIARLYDGGTTEDGRPYFALEYVEGMHLDDYCDRHKLTVDERLKLFKQVCAAVAYAHRNLVVHRDIKPANILVTDDGTVKLMDFGIAKLLNPELSLIAGDPTAKELRVMTPEYASPEQVRGERITTASDVYSLGVLLYELLTGHRPYRIKERIRSEIERVICEQEPEKPSTAISKIEEIIDRASSSGSRTPVSSSTRTLTPESVSATRSSKPEALRRRLAGDIDNIILMAMRKEPMRRYSSVEHFAEDIERHIDGRPVSARPASVVYRSSKFVKRHKAGVALAALVAVSLTAFVVAGFATARATAEIATREALEAKASEAALRNEQLETLAQASAERAERSERYLMELSNVLAHDFNRAFAELEGATLARELFVTTALSMLQAIEADRGAVSDPKLQLQMARVYYEVGGVQAGLRNPSRGDLEAAIKSYTAALELRERMAAAEPSFNSDREFQLDLSRTWARTGDVRRMAGLPADEAYRKQFQIVASLYEKEPENLPLRLAMATAMENRAASHVQQGNHQLALADYTEAHAHYHAIQEQRPENENLIRNVAILELRIASMAHAVCDYAQANDWASRSLRQRQHLENIRPSSTRYRRDVAVAQRFIGAWHRELEVFESAQMYLEASLEGIDRLANGDPNDLRVHTDRAEAHEELGLLHWRLGDVAAASESFNMFHALARPLQEWDSDNARAMMALSRSHERLGMLQLLRGEAADSIRSLRDATEITARFHEANPEHVGRKEDLARQQAGLAKALTRTNMLTEASTLLAQSRSIYEDLLEQQPENCHYRRALVGVIAQQANLSALRGDAQTCLQLAHHGLEVGQDVPEVTATLYRARSLGLRLQGNQREADQALEQALALLESQSHLDVEQIRLLDTITAELKR